MITANCPQCQNKINLVMPLVLGQRLTCSVCNTPLEIIWLYPVSLDMIEAERPNSEMKSPDEDVSEQPIIKEDELTHNLC